MAGKRDVQRDEKGRLKPGTASLNPGGVPKRALELRRIALDKAETWLQRLDDLTNNDDPMVAVLALKTAIPRALGKEAAPSEMPDDMPLPEATDSSPKSLLSRSLALLERSIARFEALAAAGTPLTESQLAQLGEHARTLATLAKEERELAKAGAGADLPDEKLAEEVIARVPVETLQAVLAKRGAK